MTQLAERLEFNAWNGHVVRGDGAAYMLHVPTTAVFGVDDLGLAVIDAFRVRGGRSRNSLGASRPTGFARSRRSLASSRCCSSLVR